MTDRKAALDAGTIEKIDRITQILLMQLEAQTQAALALLEQAPPEDRDAFLAQLAELRGRLVRLRARLVGPTAPVLVVWRSARWVSPPAGAFFIESRVSGSM